MHLSVCVAQLCRPGTPPPHAYRGLTIRVGPHTLSSIDSSRHVGIHVVHVGSRDSATYQCHATSASRVLRIYKTLFHDFFKEINSKNT